MLRHQQKRRPDMATYTSEDVKQLLEGSAKINEERKMIIQFVRMVAGGISGALKLRDVPAGGDTITLWFPGVGKQPSIFQIEWESKICAPGYNVRAWWDGINLLTQGAEGLSAKEVAALYNRLHDILEMATAYFPSLTPQIQFFIDAGARR